MNDNQSDKITWSGDSMLLSWAELYEVKAKSREWANEYMATPWSDSFDIGDDCEYLEARGGREWVEAQVIDYLVEDRPYYVIEYIDHLGRLRDGKAQTGELRRVCPNRLDT